MTITEKCNCELKACAASINLQFAEARTIMFSNARSLHTSLSIKPARKKFYWAGQRYVNAPELYSGSVPWKFGRTSPIMTELFRSFTCEVFDAWRDNQVVNFYNKYLFFLEFVHGRASFWLWLDLGSCYITSGRTARENIFQSRIQGNVCLSLSDGSFAKI